MKYAHSAQMADFWGISETLVRRYCREGRIADAYQKGGFWYISIMTPKPTEKEPRTVCRPKLLRQLEKQLETGRNKGLYDYIQVNMAYSNCRMASNRLTRNQVEVLYKSDKIYTINERIKVNDIIEIRNQFNCMDYLLRTTLMPLSQALIQNLHALCLSDCCGHRRRPSSTQGYRTVAAPDKYGKTAPPKEIGAALEKLFRHYESKRDVSFRDILELHVLFERIRPFEDFNGRIGRLLMFKECLRYGITPFIIDDKRRTRYLEGIQKWDREKGILMDVCMEAQIRFEAQMELQEIRRDPLT